MSCLLRHAKVRLLIDRVLDRMARGTGFSLRIGNWILRTTLPGVAAAVEFRAGNLTRAAELAPADSRIGRRSREMLRHLVPGRSRDEAAAAGSPQNFNGRVLFVLHSTPSYDHNGYAVRSCQIVRSLNHAGVETVLAARLGYPWDLPGRFQYSDQYVSSYDDLSFHHMRDPDLLISTSDEAYLDRYQSYLESLIDRYDCSVVHSHSNYLNGLAGARAASSRGCTAIYEMRGLWHVTRASADEAYGYSEHYRYCERMELQAARASHRVVTISRALRSWLVERGIPSEKIWVVGNAAELAESTRNPRPGWAGRSHGPFRLGYVGSLVAYEGLDVLLQAMRMLLDSGADVTLDVAGDGPDRPRLMKLRTSLQLDDAVCFLGRVPSGDVPSLYAGFDACPLPRRRLPVTELVPPLKPFEVMAHGVPVIASSVAPMLDVVEDEETGLLCEPDSAESLAAAIRKLIDDPGLHGRLVAEAGKRLREKFTWERNAQVYLAAYRR